MRESSSRRRARAEPRERSRAEGGFLDGFATFVVGDARRATHFVAAGAREQATRQTQQGVSNSASPRSASRAAVERRCEAARLRRTSDVWLSSMGGADPTAAM